MRRLHLFEFEDQPWLPGFLRDGMTAFLEAAHGISPMPAAWAQILAETLRACGSRQIVDLGSGSGGPMVRVLGELRKLGIDASATLTDIYPRQLRPNPGVTYWPDPVDARAVPPALAGVRTMFASFHHLLPADARRILADAARRKQPLLIFEATSRTAPGIATALVIPLMVLLLTPSIRPVSWLRIAFTYLIPVLPIIIFWDGLVSHLRTYSPAELLAMARESEEPGYRWTAGSIPVAGLGGVPYLVGCPEAATAADSSR